MSGFRFSAFILEFKPHSLKFFLWSIFLIIHVSYFSNFISLFLHFTFLSYFFLAVLFSVFISCLHHCRWFPSSSPLLPSNSRFSLYLFPLDSREPLSQLCTFCAASPLFSSKSSSKITALVFVCDLRNLVSL